MLSLVNQYIVVLDACVLLPMPLCDTLLRLAEEPAFFLPRWSSETLHEVERNLRKWGYSEVQAVRRVAAMRTAFDDAEVDGYEDLLCSLKNDPKDRHVLAAAIRSGAHAIVTGNLRDFPPETTAPYGLDLMSADEFLLNQFHLDADTVLTKVTQQAARVGVSVPILLAKIHEAPRFREAVLAELG